MPDVRRPGTLMNMSRAPLLAILLIIAPAVFAQHSPSVPEQVRPFLPTRQEAVNAGFTSATDIQFWRAMQSAHLGTFVLIHVARPNAPAETFATRSRFLLGAIHREHRLPYTQEGQDAALAIALRTSGQLFSFSKRRALKNIPRYYTPSVLAEVRAGLSAFSTAALLEGFSIHGDLHEIYSCLPHPTAHAYEYAVAHVLLERGLIPHMHSQVLVHE